MKKNTNPTVTPQTVSELNRLKSEHSIKRDLESAPEESVSTFDLSFAEQIRTIKSEISSLTPENILKNADIIKQSIASTSAYLNQSCHFLNSYTILHAQQKINQLTEEIQTAQASLAPRKKFAFTKKAVKKEVVIENKVQAKEINIVLEGIQNGTGLEVVKRDEELKNYNCYQLKNLKNCKIWLLGRLKAVHILNLEDCEIVIGPVAGAAHITECVGCKIYVAAHQIRIHQSQNTDFYVFVATNPIVENVKSVRFAPYAVSYGDIDKHFESSGLGNVNRWDNVQDFKWLKNEKSPNWEILVENERKEIELD